MKIKRKIRVTKFETGNSTRKSLRGHLVFVVLTILVVASVFMLTINVTSGSKLAKLEQEESELVKKNSQLSNSLFEKSSLLKFKNNAEALGYTKPQFMMYVHSDETVAVAR
jgi:Tfp pilus assembly protein PilO